MLKLKIKKKKEKTKANIDLSLLTCENVMLGSINIEI